MVDVKIETFTAKQLVELGLIEDLKRGNVKISGTYEIDENGNLNYEQNNFTFTDKFGKLRAGAFKNSAELLKFPNFVQYQGKISKR